MPANFESGFTVREPAWHGLAEVLDEYPGTWDEARKLAGLEWEAVKKVSYERVENATGEPVLDSDGRTQYAPIDGFYTLVRSDNGKPLHQTRDSWTVIPIGEMGPIVESIVEQPNVQYETAGSVNDGRQVWALLRIGEDIVLPGDFTPVRPYMAILNAFDGTASCKVVSTAVRVVCANTWHAADVDARATGFAYSIRHTRNWQQQVEQAREALTGARKQFRQVMAEMEELLQIPITEEQQVMFAREFVRMPEDGLISERVKNNVEKARADLMRLMQSETTLEVSNTAYGMVQAAGEYLDHVRGFKTNDTYLGRTLLRPEKLKLKAVGLARKIAAEKPAGVKASRPATKPAAKKAPATKAAARKTTARKPAAAKAAPSEAAASKASA
jgi:phage/plasmid-like protein (TIGR03299 family)